MSMGPILGTLTKLRIPTISYLTSVRLSAGRRGGTRLPIVQTLMKFVFFFQNLSRKFMFDCTLTQITGTLHEDLRIFFIISG